MDHAPQQAWDLLRRQLAQRGAQHLALDDPILKGRRHARAVHLWLGGRVERFPADQPAATQQINRPVIGRAEEPATDVVLRRPRDEGRRSCLGRALGS